MSESEGKSRNPTDSFTAHAAQVAFCSSSHRALRLFHFLVQSLIGLGENPAVAGSIPCFSQNIFCAFANPDETEGSSINFFRHLDIFETFHMLLKAPPFDFIEVPPRNIRSKALYPIIFDIISELHCIFQDEEEVRQQEFFIKTSCGYFQNRFLSLRKNDDFGRFRDLVVVLFNCPFRALFA